LMGSQYVWMILDYFKTNRSLQEQYTWEDMATVRWLGDDKLHDFYAKWNLVVDSLITKMPEEVLITAFLERIRNSKQLLAPDVHEFDRWELDDPRRTLKWLTDAVERVLSRQRMADARKVQKERMKKDGLGLDGNMDAKSMRRKARARKGKKKERRAKEGERTKEKERAARRRVSPPEDKYRHLVDLKDPAPTSHWENATGTPVPSCIAPKNS